MNNKNTNQPASTNYLINKQLIQNIWPFCAIVALLLISGFISISTLSAVRSYVNAQSNWSKSHIEAVFHLNQYAKTHNEADFKQFINELELSLHDKAARLAMQESKPNIQQAKVALMQKTILTMWLAW